MISVFYLLALAVFCLHPARAAQSTRNDLLRALSLQVVKQPEPPICCLRPLDTPEDDIPLSFEQWKARQSQVQKVNRSVLEAPTPSAVKPHDVLPFVSGELPVEVEISPHILVPLTDRFNYASLDCSARVHTSHRAAKSTSSILSSKRDRYMLSPCSSVKTGPKYVVVELCDDIRIDTVQLANFEFFSGVFKDISVSVAKTYSNNPDAWAFAGTHRAKNIRGVQSFHPPPTLRDFYRYIRIDFHSHYGSEYYCPVSLLRVYGLTHLEEWKWDTWESESKAKAEAARERRSISSAVVVQPSPEPVALPIGPMSSASLESTIFASFETTKTSARADKPTDAVSSTSPTVASTTTETVIIPDAPATESQPSSTLQTASAPVTTISTGSTMGGPLPAPSFATGGESIYRTIMNRLTALETNHTLYTRYVEEQTAGIREGMRRMAEDIGRIEGIGKSQAQMFQKTLLEWERYRLRLEVEHHDLLSRVNYLADEIVLEKRLGIAQLCLLLAVLVFMGLTRGSRGEEPFLIPGPESKQKVKAWGRRNLSFSGDWVNRIRKRSMSDGLRPSAEASDIKPLESKREESKVKFPSHEDPIIPLSLSRRANLPSSSRPRSRTPSLKHHPRANNGHQHRPSTPTRPRMRANSHGAHDGSSGMPTSPTFAGIGPVPKSAKRWARSAHLHEVKRGRRENHDERDIPLDSNGAGPSWYPPPLITPDGETDMWVDTDASIDGSDAGDTGSLGR